MGEAAERTEESLVAIRESLDLVHAQIGSMDARMGLMDSTYQQVAAQLDLHSRAVSDHTRVMDAIEQRQESMAKHLAATADAIARLCGSKPSSEATEEEDAEPVCAVGKAILRPVTVGGCRGVPPGGTMHPGSSSSTQPPDQGSGQELQFIDWAGRPPKHGGQGPLSEPASGGDHSRDQASGKVPLKMNFPKFDGAFPRIWRDKCLDYFRVCNIHPTMWLTVATLHLERNAAHWFQAYKLKNVVQGWPDFITAVEAQFGVDDYRQFMSSLLSLK
jgi:hypothetical protein